MKKLVVIGLVFLINLLFVFAVCPDGTPNGQCSVNPDVSNADSWGQPYRCVNDELVADCDTCGCFGEQQSCNSPGKGDCTAFNHIRTWSLDYGNGHSQSDYLWFAQHFDFLAETDDLGYFRLYSNAPVCRYDNYFDLYVYGDKWEYLQNRASTDGIPFEDLFYHLRKDTLWNGRYIPGWNSANDGNNDGINDYHFTELRTFTWDNTQPFEEIFGSDIEWVNNVWIYNDNSDIDPLNYGGKPSVDDTDEFTVNFDFKGECSFDCGVSVQNNGNSGTYYVIVEVFGQLQSGAPDPDAHATNLAQARTRDYYWTAPDQPNGLTQRFMPNMGNSNYQVYNSDYTERLTRQPSGFGNIYHFSGIMIDNTGGSWPSYNTPTNEIIEMPDTWGLTGSALQAELSEQFSDNYAATIAKVKELSPDKLQYPNCFSYCNEKYIPNINGVLTEWYLRERNDAIWAINDAADAEASQVNVLQMAITSDMTENLERNYMSMLALHYISKNDYIYFRHGQTYHDPYQQWFDAIAYDVGAPTSEYYIWATGTDPSYPSRTYTIYARDYENALMLYKQRAISTQSYQDYARVVSGQGPFTFPSNEMLDVTVNGGAVQNVPISAGTYTSDELAAYLDPLIVDASAASGWPTAGSIRIDAQVTGASENSVLVGGSANAILQFPTTKAITSFTTHTLPTRFYRLQSDGTLETDYITQISLTNQMGAVLIREESLTPCTVGEVRSCGPENETGICQYGTQLCEDISQGSDDGRWATCTDAVYPESEICQDGIDQDCSGSDLLCEECQPGAAPAEGCICNGELLLGGEFCPYGPGGSIIFQEGYLDYSGTVDAGIGAQTPDTTSNLYQMREVGEWTTRGVIRFELGSLSGTVQSAELSLYQTYSNGPSEVRLYPILKNWTKPGVTWNCVDDVDQNGCIFPETAWDIPGISGPTDRGITFASTDIDATNGWKTWDVTSLVKQWIELGDANYGLLISEQAGLYHRFNNAQNSDQTLRPKLEIIISSSNCTIPYDVEPCNCIDFDEVISSINGWYTDNITLTELIRALKMWKAGC